MRKTITIIIGKIFVLVGKLLHRGSSLPGGIALKLYPNLMHEFKMPEIVIAVTGSSGKGSITSMIAEICKKDGYQVAHNSKGSNLSAGITTLLLEHSTLNGSIKSDIVIAEVDERYCKYVFPCINPNYVVISNITRDQPPRQGHFDLVYQEIKKALTSDMHLIISGDDPMLQKFVLEKENPVTYYGIDKNRYSYIVSKFKNLNFTYCPICHTKLIYDYYHFEEIGDYHCPNCHFKRPKIDITCTDIDYDNKTITIQNDKKTHIPYQLLYCVYNTLAAYTATKLIGIKEDVILSTTSEIAGNTKNFSVYQYQERNVHVLNNKNENSSTFNQSILYVDRMKGEKTIVIGWKEISRRYAFDDLSWLYDIDFEILAKHDINQVICVGLHCYDIATRVKYANIDEKKIKTFDSLEEAVPYIKEKTKGDIFAILNFDYVIPFHELMNGSEKK